MDINKIPMKTTGVISSAILTRESKVFSEKSVDPKKCESYLKKFLSGISSVTREDGILYLNKKEYEIIFFNITKAFQFKDAWIRRLTYLGIKKIYHEIQDMLIIIMSSLINSSSSSQFSPTERSEAIRLLCHIIDPNMLQSISKSLTTGMVSQSTELFNSTMAGCIYLVGLGSNVSIVSNWFSVNVFHLDDSKRYLGLLLASILRLKDPSALYCFYLKAIDLPVMSYSGDELNDAMCQITIIKLYKLVYRLGYTNAKKPNWESLLSTATTNDAVVAEAMDAVLVCDKDPEIIKLMLPSLTSFLDNTSTYKFYACRIISKIADILPSIVEDCNRTLESLISFPSRAVATQALSALLKTSTSKTVERLVKQAESLLKDTSEELCIEIINSMVSLTEKFPKQSMLVVSFFKSRLEDSGSMEYKLSIINALGRVMSLNQYHEHHIMEILCDLLEDCEFIDVAVQILYLIAIRAESQLSRTYLRYIHNRFFLEMSSVKMATISALETFILKNNDETARDILQICLKDSCPQIRQRASMTLASKATPHTLTTDTLDLDVLEDMTRSYIETGNYDRFIDLSISTKKIIDPAAIEVNRQFDLPDTVKEVIGDSKLISTSSPITHSGSVVDFSVETIKHIYMGYVVLEHRCKNLADGQIVLDMSVVLMVANTNLQLIKLIPISELYVSDTYKTSYGIYRYEKLPLGSYFVGTTFSTAEEGPDGQPLASDDFPWDIKLENLDLIVSDFVLPVAGDALNTTPSKTDTAQTVTFTIANTTSVEQAVTILKSELGGTPMPMTQGRVADLVFIGLLFTHIVHMRASLFSTDQNVVVELEIIANPELSHEIMSIAEFICS